MHWSADGPLHSLQAELHGKQRSPLRYLPGLQALRQLDPSKSGFSAGGHIESAQVCQWQLRHDREPTAEQVLHEGSQRRHSRCGVAQLPAGQLA